MIPSERRISAITETFWNLLRDCPPAEAVAALEIVLARAREKAGMVKPKPARTTATQFGWAVYRYRLTFPDTREAGLREALERWLIWWTNSNRDAASGNFMAEKTRAALAAIPAPAPLQSGEREVER